MHMFSLEHRFMGGYGIVGGNLPLAAGMAMASDYLGTEEVTVCVFGDGAANQGPSERRQPRGALGPSVVFMVTNNQFGLGTAIERIRRRPTCSSAARATGCRACAATAWTVADTHAVMAHAIRQAREERRPLLVEALTTASRAIPRPIRRSTARRPQVEEWRKRDPIETFGRRLVEEEHLEESELAQLDEEVVAVVDAAVEFADGADFPPPESLFEHLYAPGGAASEMDPVGRGPTRRTRKPRTWRRRGRGQREGAGGRVLMAEIRYREALNQALREELQRDDRVLLLGEDIGVFQGAFKVTHGLLDEFGGKRVRDTPISENTIVGMGVGAAMTGLRPWSS
jgi:hypothetical protein